MKAWTRNKPYVVVMVIVRCDVKVKGGLHATICRHDYILESKKKCYLGPDRHSEARSEASFIENDFSAIK